jgi:hypothetical protein
MNGGINGHSRMGPGRQSRAARFADFASKFPQLLPPNITGAAFIARLTDEVTHFPQHEAAVKQFLHTNPDLIALCHWNANVDNAWFWRNPGGELACGLMDWGNVSQMNVTLGRLERRRSRSVGSPFRRAVGIVRCGVPQLLRSCSRH